MRKYWESSEYIKTLSAYKEIARLSLDDVKELANNFDLDIQYCDEIK